MTQYFIGLIHKDPDSDFGVSFPDLPGCVTAGTSLDEARAMAEEALTFHLEGLRLDGYDIPAPSSLTEIMNDPENRDGVAILVPLEIPVADRFRFGVEVSGDMLAQIDAFAERHGLDREGFFRRAAEHELEHG